tara:strand:- start:111990 stop:116984 length:4995 start_codon:yes stop_codon:yes gene_type:complete
MQGGVKQAKKSEGASTPAAPSVASVSPSNGLNTGGYSLSITGTGFTFGATVQIGTTDCPNVSYINSNQITCNVNSGTVGTYDVTVTNPDNQEMILANAFTYRYPTPNITSVSPTSGSTLGGTTLTLTGVAFRSGATVTVNGSTCNTVTIVSSTSATCVTSTSAAATGDIVITNDDGEIGTLTNGYTYQPPPTVTGVSLNSGPVTGAANVTITGTGFLTGATADLGGSNCNGVIVASSTSLTCTTNAHAAGLVTATVTNTDTQSGSLANAYQYRVAPTVTGIAPTSGLSQGGTGVTITGTGFVTGATVSIGGTTCTSPVVGSATSITCTAGASAAGTYDVVVTNPDTQIGTLAGSFTYIAAPTLTSVTLSAGPVGGGAIINLVGTNFVSGATITVGGSTCTVPTFVNAISMTCVTPALAAGTYDVVVTNPDTQTGTLVNSYTTQAAPTVTVVSPVTGPLAGGTTMTITGTNFRTGASVSVVGTSCTSATVVNSTTMTCVTAARTAGNGNVVVTNTDAQSGTLASAFTYQGAPTVTSVVPSNGVDDGGTAVTINGTNFASDISNISFGGSACASVVWVNSTQLTCTTTAHASGSVSVTATNQDGQTGTLAAAYTYDPNPTITSLSPSNGVYTGGDLITVTGTNFVSGATVDLGGSACTPVTFVSSTSLTCTTTAHAAGSVTATVTNPDAQTGTLASAFTFDPPPTVTSVTNSAGTNLGGTLVTITGTAFVSGATVDFGGSACTPVTFVNSTSMTCTTTAHAVGAVTVTVTNPDTQTGTLASGFSYQLAPTLSNVSPSFGPSAGGQTVTLTGTGFVAGATVDFGGSACTGVNVISATSISCITGAHANGAVSVTMTNADTQFVTLATGYIYIAAPTVTSVVANSGPNAGGTAVTITGTGFLAGATVDFGGSACGSVVVVSSTSITCTTSAHATGAVTVTVTNSDSQAGTLASGFTYIPAPTVTSVSPTAGALAGGTAVTITGSGYTAGATVDFGGSACGGVTVVSATSITCTTTAHAAGAVTVTVTNTDTQSGNLATAYTYQAAPTVSGVAPTSGILAGGTAVTITGTGYVTSASVSIGGVACSGVNVVGPTTITCTTGANTTGAKTVTVTNADTQNGSLATAYTYDPAPGVTSVAPSAGALAGSTAIVITGTDFVSGATVTIDGLPCTGVTFVNATTINCTTPTHAAGSVNVMVINPDTQAGTGTNVYTYQPAPNVTSVSPNAGALAGGTTVTVTGTNFVAGATVDLGGSNCGTVNVTSSTTLTCITTAHAAGAVTATVTNADTQTGNVATAYTYQAAPTVTTVTLNRGPTAGGSAVTVAGTGFLTGATVDFGGSACGSVTVVTANSITCTTTAHAAGAVTVTVTNADSQSGNQASAFTYDAPPTVTSITPNSGILTGGTAVTVTGSGYYAGASVDFGGSACGGITVVNATTITCTTTAHATGAVTVTVTNADAQSGNLSSGFTYSPTPTVSSVSPSSGATSGSTLVTITGVNFVSGATVDFGGSACTPVTFNNSTSLTCTTTAHAAGAITATVTNPDTQTGNLASAYTYAAAANLSWQVGGASPTPPNPDNYGSLSTNVTHTFTLENNGAVTSGTISTYMDGSAPAAWLVGTDNCNGTTLAPAATCTVQLTFLGAFLGSGSYSANINANATASGTAVNAVQATVP